MTERWRNFFDGYGAFEEDWLKSSVLHWGFHESLYGNIIRTCPPPAKIIDIGCGPGWSAIYLSSLGYDVVGLDNEASLVELATRNAERLGSNARFVCGDAFDLSRLNECFDLAYSCGVLEHFEREVTIELLRQQSAHAKHVLIQIPSRYTAYTGQITDERIYSIAELRRIVVDAGLILEKSFGYGELNVTLVHRGLRQILPRAAWRILQNLGYCYSLAVIGKSTAPAVNI
jgi:SAM-dependent methyltransferase